MGSRGRILKGFETFAFWHTDGKRAHIAGMPVQWGIAQSKGRRVAAAKINPPASLCCSLHQGRLHDGDATANPGPEPGGDPGPLQRRAADARDHGGLYHYAPKDLQICVCRRPGKVRGVDGRVWVCVKRIYSGGPKRWKQCWRPWR